MIREKLEKLGFKHFPEINSLGNYKPYKIFNNLIFISGQLPLKDKKLLATGKITSDVDMKNAIKIINLATSNLLNVLEFAIRQNKLDINKIGCLNIRGYLNTDENFKDHSILFNHCSELVVKILGEKFGSHSRSVIGVKSLPLNSPVEIEAVFSLNE